MEKGKTRGLKKRSTVHELCRSLLAMNSMESKEIKVEKKNMNTRAIICIYVCGGERDRDRLTQERKARRALSNRIIDALHTYTEEGEGEGEGERTNERRDTKFR